jgi:hypothetical protein
VPISLLKGTFGLIVALTSIWKVAFSGIVNLIGLPAATAGALAAASAVSSS